MFRTEYPPPAISTLLLGNLPVLLSHVLPKSGTLQGSKFILEMACYLFSPNFSFHAFFWQDLNNLYHFLFLSLPLSSLCVLTNHNSILGSFFVLALFFIIGGTLSVSQLSDLPLSWPKCPEHTFIGLMKQLQSYPLLAERAVVPSALFSCFMFKHGVMDNRWLAQKSSNKETLGSDQVGCSFQPHLSQAFLLPPV